MRTITLSVDQILERVCAGVATRKGILAETGRTAADTVRAAMRVSNPAGERFAGSAERCALDDFLVLPDQDFIDAAYRVVLRRRADPTGAQHYLAALRDGAMSKAEVLGRLRFSPEGRRLKVTVKGLVAAFALAQIRSISCASIAGVVRALRLRRP